MRERGGWEGGASGAMPQSSTGLLLVLGLAALAGLSGCAWHGARRTPVNIEARPTPALADTARRPSAPPAPAPAAKSSPTQPVESPAVLAARDTAAAGAMLRRCAGRRPLPDQENTWDAVSDLLVQVRRALLAGDDDRARSLARDARQLATSLYCP